MKYIYQLIVLVLMTGLIACETEIEFNGKEVEPVLVLNCLTCTDSTLEVKLTASRFFLSNVDTFTSITNASIVLKANDLTVETLVHKGNGIYTSTYKPQAGERITLIASAPGFETISTTEDFPLRIADYSVDSTISTSDTMYQVDVWGTSDGNGMTWYKDTIGQYYNVIHRYTIRFTDPPGKKDFYRLIVQNNTYHWADSLLLSGTKSYSYGFKNIVFDSGESGGMEGIAEDSNYDPLNLFTDELIDGSTHTINIEYHQLVYTNIRPGHQNDYYTTPRRHKLDIQLQPISKSYYLFLKTFQAFDNTDPFMSEPVQIYTNVKNGLGIFGARTQQIKSFVLPIFQ